MKKRRRSRSLSGVAGALGITSCAPIISPGQRVSVCLTKPNKGPGEKVEGPDDVCRLLRKAKDADRESMYVIHLDVQNHVIGVEEVARGAIDWVATTPREILKGAIMSNAAAIILAHNHPSGSPEPSNADVEITNQLIAAAGLLDIPVRDHVIVAERGCSSLRTMNRAQGFKGTSTKRR
jgi:DNA repair protein RadC